MEDGGWIEFFSFYNVNSTCYEGFAIEKCLKKEEFHVFKKNDGTVGLSHVDYIACSARDLNPRPLTFKQPLIFLIMFSNWTERRSIDN